MIENEYNSCEPVRTIFKKRNASNSSSWDQISLWQMNAIKIHAHSLSPDDDILNKYGYGYAYCACGDKIIGLGNGYRVRHNPLSNSVRLSMKVSGDFPHLATNMTDEVIGCAYGSNLILHYTVDENNNESTTTVVPINSETKYIGAQYVEGLWVLISETNVYYTKDVTKGFNSIKYTDNGDSTIRYSNTCVCKYGDYYYIIGIGYQGATLRIQINAGNLSITKVDYSVVNDFNYCIAIISATSDDGIGTSPVVVTAGAGHYMTIFHGNSPLELTDYNGTTTSIFCSRTIDKGSGTGFECGKRKISLLYNCTQGSTIGSLIYDLDTNETYFIKDMNTKYGGNPKIFGFDCGTHYAAYTWYTSGVKTCDIFSSSNGITWQRNWGYLYMENVDRTHNIITSVMEKLNSSSKDYAFGQIIGTGEYTTSSTSIASTTMSIPIDFVPEKIYMSCYSKLNDSIEYKSKTLTFEDRNKELWKLTSNPQIDENSTTEITIDCWRFKDGIVYTSIEDINYKYNSIGTYTWDGENLIITGYNYRSDISNINAKNYIYNWEAFGGD